MGRSRKLSGSGLVRKQVQPLWVALLKACPCCQAGESKTEPHTPGQEDSHFPQLTILNPLAPTPPQTAPFSTFITIILIIALVRAGMRRNQLLLTFKVDISWFLTQNSSHLLLLEMPQPSLHTIFAWASSSYISITHNQETLTNTPFLLTWLRASFSWLSHLANDEVGYENAFETSEGRKGRRTWKDIFKLYFVKRTTLSEIANGGILISQSNIEL